MAAQTRIYVVFDHESKRLIRATHPSHAALALIDVHVASQDELVALLGRGVDVEAIKHEQQELPA